MQYKIVTNIGIVQIVDFSCTTSSLIFSIILAYSLIASIELHITWNYLFNNKIVDSMNRNMERVNYRAMNKPRYLTNDTFLFAFFGIRQKKTTSSIVSCIKQPQKACIGGYFVNETLWLVHVFHLNITATLHSNCRWDMEFWWIGPIRNPQ